MATADSVARLVEQAKVRIESLDPARVAVEATANSALLVDLREADERAQHGIIAGAMHAPRGMIEFYADPDTPYYRPEFTPPRRIVLHCSCGCRSALAALALTELGYTNVAQLAGGFDAWRAAGHPVVAVNDWSKDA